MKCIFCLRTGNTTAPRIKEHILGSDNTGLSKQGVSKCKGPHRLEGQSQTEFDVEKEKFIEMKDALQAACNKKRKALTITKKVTDLTQTAISLDNSPLGKLFKKSRSDVAGRSLARAFYSAGIPPNVLANPWMKLALKDIAGSSSYSAPSPKQLLTTFLEEEHQRVKKIVNGERRKPGNTEMGMCLVGDGATNIRSDPILNILAVQGKRVEFIEARNCAGYVKDGRFIADMFIETIKSFGAETIVAVLQDNATRSSWPLIEKQFPHIVAAPCMPHVVDLLLEDIGKMPFIRDTLKELGIVRGFIRRHQAVKAAFDQERQHSKQKSAALIKPCAVRFSVQVISVDNILTNEAVLCNTMKNRLNTEYVARNKKTKHKPDDDTDKRTIPEIYGIVSDICSDNNRTFFKKLESIMLIFKPIAKLLRYSEQDLPIMSKMYYAWHHVIEVLESYSDRIPDVFLDEVIDKCHKRWNYGYSLLQGVGYLLDPSFSQCEYDDNLWNDFKNYIDRQYVVKEPDVETRRRVYVAPILQEFNYYRQQMGHYSCEVAMSERTKMQAAEWWQIYGSRNNENTEIEGELRRIAIRVTMCVAGAAASERGHKEMAFVHTKVRNRLSDERMNKLVYIRMNLQTMEDKAIENWGDAEVFNLDDGDDNEVRNVGEEMGRLDIAWLDAGEDALITDEEQNIENSLKRHKKMSNPKKNPNASQIGWVLDVNETAEKCITRTGRKSRLPAHLREEVYGGAVNLNKEVNKEVIENHEEDYDEEPDEYD